MEPVTSVIFSSQREGRFKDFHLNLQVKKVYSKTLIFAFPADAGETGNLLA